MDERRPVIATISVRLRPGFEAAWLEAWKDLRDRALSEATCRAFRVLGDGEDAAHCVVVSEWDRAADYDAFIRKSGVIWLERALGGTTESPTYAVYQAIPQRCHLVSRDEVVRETVAIP